MIATETVNAVAFPHLSPTTAIGWLKAIGLLRLSEARGYWLDDCFYLEIDSAASVVEKILNHYQPKPFASPWNSYSIFNKPDSLKSVLTSQSERYVLMREGYHKIQDVLQTLDIKKQSSAEKKLTLMHHLTPQVESPDWHEWINAVGLVTKTKKGPRFLCNDLLGTGGNIGTTDFCTVYFQMCSSELWDLNTGEPSPKTEAFIRASILGETLPNTLLEQSLLGHTYPAADYFDDLAPSGGSQADYLDNGGRSSQLANPIDLILYLEGATTFTGKAIPRNQVKNEGDQEYTFASYPLLLEVNSGSADTSDLSERSYEVWLPLWNEPKDWGDFQQMVTQDLSFRLTYQIVDTLDMLKLITQVDEYRGLSRFARFGLWQRKGQCNYLVHIGLATPGGTDFAAELREWRLTARLTANHSQAQCNLLTAIHKALYRLQQGNAEATTVIRLLGQLEGLHSRIQPKIPPVPQLGEKWVEAVYREYPIVEVELAAALASTSLIHKQSGHSAYTFRRLLSSARYNPKTKSWFWSQEHHHKLKTASLEALCLSLLRVWHEDKTRHPAFGWTYRASPDAIAAFIAGNTNDSLILELALGFALCEIPATLAPHAKSQPLPEPYKYAASLQWNSQTVLTAQTINGLMSGSTVPLSRQLAAMQKPVVLPSNIAIGKRSALALVFPCQPFYSLGENNG